MPEDRAGLQSRILKSGVLVAWTAMLLGGVYASIKQPLGIPHGVTVTMTALLGFISLTRFGPYVEVVGDAR